jgi:hypothetical protein
MVTPLQPPLVSRLGVSGIQGTILDSVDDAIDHRRKGLDPLIAAVAQAK